MAFLDALKDNWQFITSIVAVAVAWWRFSIRFSNQQILNDQRIKDLETTTVKVEARVDAVYPVLVTLQTDMASVKTSVDFIKMSMGQIIKNQ